MLFFNLLGVLAAPYRLFVSDPGHPGTISSPTFAGSSSTW